MPKFKSPDGRIFSNIHNAFLLYCSYHTCDDRCVYEKYRKFMPCGMYAENSPIEAARLMGYEIIEDDQPEINQEAKSDGGKPRPSLVPPALIRGVDAIREYGCKKYSDPENWRRVEPQRYWEATLRHALAAWDNWQAVDEESGMPAIWHMACNLSFLMQYMEDGNG